jgi:NADH pyrophosphatase NudC (nudix superfamily)
MSAQTPWWYCGKCGFPNHPRANQDEKKCEQCGAESSEPNAIDYRPTGA